MPTANQFALVVSVTILSLLLAPYMVACAENWALFTLTRLFGADRFAGGPSRQHPTSERMHVLIIGFGPAGERVALALKELDVHSHVIELNPHSAARAQKMGLHVHSGDAASSDMLGHIGVQAICAAVITLPDPKTGREVIANLNLLLPGVPIITRSRYHRYVKDLNDRGATVVVDEESTVGEKLADQLIDLMRKPNREAMACALTGERSV